MPFFFFFCNNCAVRLRFILQIFFLAVTRYQRGEGHFGGHLQKKEKYSGVHPRVSYTNTNQCFKKQTKNFKWFNKKKKIVDTIKEAPKLTPLYIGVQFFFPLPITFHSPLLNVRFAAFFFVGKDTVPLSFRFSLLCVFFPSFF